MTGDKVSSAEPDEPGETPARRFPIVGIGSSAGGVRALQQLFESLPDVVDAAFVVIVHLDPAHQSELPAILAARTRMPVAQVSGRVSLEPRHVYVIPPNRQLLADDHHLALAEFDEPRWQRAPIDLFFRSLAAQHGDDFAIVLSGAGSDGALGIKAVKEAGGIILVQDPEEAEYGSMPRSAIATGLADFVLPVREIAERLPELIAVPGNLPVEPEAQSDSEDVQGILSHLRVRTGHDFSNYRKSTVRRRILRRMQVRRAATMSAYLSILRESGEEAQALQADLLISVTTFFRDSGAFNKLASLVIPHLFEGKGAADTVRVWVPGCASGEEAYSLAILLLEEAGRHDIRCQIQVFGSDLDDSALLAAREGRYPLAIETDMIEERLKRFFTRESDHYRVSRELRDLVLFARHSLLKDPPFSRVDLISCRNVLIYLERSLQRQVCSTFHFALNPSGYLFLGASESADSPPGMFRPLDREAQIYQRMRGAADGGLRARVNVAPFSPEALSLRAPAPLRPALDAASHREALEQLAPPSILVDESFRATHLSESAGRYLQPSGGPFSNDITQLVREELRFDLRAALYAAFARNESSLSGPIAVRFNGTARRVYLQAKCLSDSKGTRTAVVFFLEGEWVGDGALDAARIEERASEAEVDELQQELQFMQSQLRTSREEYEGANEELRAANEELQSINEEYRSTGEELETSKEELQSINEELQTVNAELKTKLDDVSRSHSDIQNLMDATDVGILFLDTELRIKRFTPHIAEIFSVADGDEGRSITDFTHSLDYQELARDARSVLSDLKAIEREARGRNGAWHLLRMRPYRTEENKIDGLVVTLVNISELRRVEDALRDSEARSRAVIDGVTDAIVTIDENGTVLSVNAATTRTFRYSVEELIGEDVETLMPETRNDFRRARAEPAGAAGVIGRSREIEGRRKDGSLFPLELTISEIRHGDERLFIGFVRDLSERRRFEARLSRLHSNRLDSMADMAAALAHEINQPLAAAANYLSAARYMLGANTEPPQPAVDEALDKASSQMLRAGQIISHLREFMGRGEPDKLEQSLHHLIRRACELVTPAAREAEVQIVLLLDAGEDAVLADRVQIEQAIVNLCRNAIEAMSQASERKLTISTSLEHGMIRADLADTGIGLSASTVSELFIPFTSTKSNGLGVGLSISRSIVEAHYGTIWAEANPGGGAKFSFTLPLARLESASG